MSSEREPPAQQRQPDADTDMPDQPSTATQPTPFQPVQPAPAVANQDNGSASQDRNESQLEQRQNISPEANPEQQQQQQSDPPEKTTPAPEIPPPGPRASRLQALFATTAKHTLDKINKENFAACFPTVANKAPGTLEFVQRQMVERLGNLWTREFETIMANRQVVARLNELETLVADAARRRIEAAGAPPPVAPHLLPPHTILHANLAPHLASHQSQLNAKLQNTQSANARLWDEIQAQRAEMEALLSGVEKVLRDVDGANALLAEVVDELAVETRAAEADVEGVGAAAGRT